MSTKTKWIYDPMDLIELVEQRPCIWDKTSEEYKDRNVKLNAWTEISHFLIDNYEFLEENDKLAAAKSIAEKWKHIRDAFALSLKKRRGDRKKKKYIYYDQLQFLKIMLQKDETSSSLCDDEKIEISDEEPTSQTADCDVATELNLSHLRKRIYTSPMDRVNVAVLKSLKATAQPPAEIDEDAGFFASITPVVRKFNDDQKIAFRMGVLGLIQQIKAQNTVTPGPLPTSRSASSHPTQE